MNAEDYFRQYRTVESFIVTQYHINLLRRMHIDWCYDEFGSPAVDPKRPFGNSDVYQDMLEILGLHQPDEWTDIAPEQADYLNSIYAQTAVALQILVSTGNVEPGEYTREKYSSNWVRSGG
jgi:hypothetical protein